LAAPQSETFCGSPESPASPNDYQIQPKQTRIPGNEMVLLDKFHSALL
jgi:hypothetical protein